MGEVSGFDDGEFYGFCSDFEQRGEKVQEESQKEIEGDEYTIPIYGDDTEEWEESKSKLEGGSNQLSRQIELSLGFGELGGGWKISKKIKTGKQMEKQKARKC